MRVERDVAGKGEQEEVDEDAEGEEVAEVGRVEIVEGVERVDGYEMAEDLDSGTEKWGEEGGFVAWRVRMRLR